VLQRPLQVFRSERTGNSKAVVMRCWNMRIPVLHRKVKYESNLHKVHGNCTEEDCFTDSVTIHIGWKLNCSGNKPLALHLVIENLYLLILCLFLLFHKKISYLHVHAHILKLVIRNTILESFKWLGVIIGQ
jgi:hypothetical protein